MKYLILLFFAFTVSGCSVTGELPKLLETKPKVQDNPLTLELNEIKPINGPPMTVGVYSFTDKTGQRKPKDNIADFSTAVSQGGVELVIDALKTAGGGKWFRVVERNGLDHLVR